MAVTFDAVGPSSAGQGAGPTVSTVTWSHTCAGTNRCVFVGVSLGVGIDTGVTMSATFGGVAMTSLGLVHSNNGTAGFIQLFRLINPNVGASTVLVTASQNVEALIGGSISFNGVDQTTPVKGSIFSAFGSSATPSIGVTSTVSGNMILDIVCTGTLISSTGQTSRWLQNRNVNTAAGNSSQSTAGGSGGTVTMTYTITSDWWGILAVEIQSSTPPVSADPVYHSVLYGLSRRPAANPSKVAY